MKWGGIVLCLLLLSCDNGPTRPGSAPEVYFQEGRVYRYDWSSAMKDSVGTILYLQTDTVTLTIASATDKIDTMTNLVKVVVTSRSGQSIVYYRNSASGLTEVAYESFGGPLVQPAVGKTRGRTLTIVPSLALSTPAVVQWLQNRPEIAKTDSAIVRTDPRVVYHYPLIAGQQWVSFTDPFAETREVVGFEDVDGPAGVKNCVVIRTELSIAPDIEWLDYVNFNGLVKRSITIKAVTTTAENPEGPGETVELTEQALLISEGNVQ